MTARPVLGHGVMVRVMAGLPRVVWMGVAMPMAHTVQMAGRASQMAATNMAVALMAAEVGAAWLFMRLARRRGVCAVRSLLLHRT